MKLSKIDIDKIISKIELNSNKSAISKFIERKNNNDLRRLVYTSFDGDYMPFLHDILKYTKVNGFLPINPEAALGYYVSTTTHHGNKVMVMKDCICEELLCDEMWVFNPINGYMPEGVIAELMIWNDIKKIPVRKIPFFNKFSVTKDTSSYDEALESYIVNQTNLMTLIKECNQNDIKEIRQKLFDLESTNLPNPAYVVANFYNYKHLDWTRAYCYQHSVCPVSPQNILPISLYSRDFANCNYDEYIVDRLTLLDKCHELLWFTNTNNLDWELSNLDIFSSTELYYWYNTHGFDSIRMIDWAVAKVPKYLNKNWALTKSETREVRPEKC